MYSTTVLLVNRQELCRSHRNSLPYAGLSADYAEVIWNEVYRVPSDINDDVCDYSLTRNLVMLTVAVVCEAIVSFVATGEQRHFTVHCVGLSQG